MAGEDGTVGQGVSSKREQEWRWEPKTSFGPGTCSEASCAARPPTPSRWRCGVALPEALAWQVLRSQPSSHAGLPPPLCFPARWTERQDSGCAAARGGQSLGKQWTQSCSPGSSPLPTMLRSLKADKTRSRQGRCSSREEKPRPLVSFCLHPLLVSWAPRHNGRNEPEVWTRAHVGKSQKPSGPSDPASSSRASSCASARPQAEAHCPHIPPPPLPLCTLGAGSLPRLMPDPHAGARSSGWTHRLRDCRSAPRHARGCCGQRCPKTPTRPWLTDLPSEPATPHSYLFP